MLMLFGVLFIVLSQVLNIFFFVIVGSPRGRFAFVFGADRVPGVAEALNDTGVFKAVFQVDGSQVAEGLCENLEMFTYTPYAEQVRNSCRSKAVVVVTEGRLAALVMFLGSRDELTQRTIEILTFERFDDGNIDIYDGEKHIGYTKGYELRRIFLSIYWDPVGVGTNIDSVVRKHETEMYEAAGITVKRGLDRMAYYMMHASILVLLFSFSLFFFKYILRQESN